MYGWRGKVGLIAVSNDLVMECDFWRMAPPGVSVHVARMNYDDNLPDPIERLRLMAPYARQAAIDVATVGPDVIIYGCTSGSFFRGRAWDEQNCKELSEVAGRPVISTARASVEAIKTLGLRRVCIATPYTDDVNALLPPYLADYGIEVVNLVGGQRLTGYEMNRLSEEEIRQLVMKSWRPDADGFFFSCTAVPSLEIIAAIERDLGKPLVTANQASFWMALRTAGVREQIEGFGQLFQTQLGSSIPARELVTA
jgi:maleate cis-trans isomerase